MQSNITKNIYWVGQQNLNQPLFENLWPLDGGITLNSYLIKDTHNVLIDAVEQSGASDLLKNIREVLKKEELHYLIINHIEPDHSGSIKEILKHYPNVKIVGNSSTFKLLEGYYGITNNLYKVANNDVIVLGKHTLRFLTAPMLHWPETMMVYCEEERLLFSGDVFSSFGKLAEGRLFDFEQRNIIYFLDQQRRYYAVVLAKYARNIIKLFNRLNTIKLKIIAPAHGTIWQQYTKQILDLYWSYANYTAVPGVVIIYGTMYGNTKIQAVKIAEYLKESGVEEVKIFDVSTNNVSYILSEILKYNGVIIGGPTYNGNLFPPVEELIRYIEIHEYKNKYLGIFGEKTWTGGAIKRLLEFAEKVSWEVINKPYETMYSPNEADFKNAKGIAFNMVNKILHKN